MYDPTHTMIRVAGAHEGHPYAMIINDSQGVGVPFVGTPTPCVTLVSLCSYVVVPYDYVVAPYGYAVPNRD